MPVSLSSPSMPVILSGAIDFTPDVSGNDGPTTSFFYAGKLPAGLTFNNSTGQLSGTPTETGTFKGAIMAVDKDGSASLAITLALDALTPPVEAPYYYPVGRASTNLTPDPTGPKEPSLGRQTITISNGQFISTGGSANRVTVRA